MITESEFLPSILSQTRKAYPLLVYNGQDITAEVYPTLKSLTYKEGVNLTADLVEVILADPDARMRSSWTMRGATPLDLTLIAENCLTALPRSEKQY